MTVICFSVVQPNPKLIFGSLLPVKESAPIRPEVQLSLLMLILTLNTLYAVDLMGL